MSRTRKPAGPSPVTLFRRRVALGAYLAFLALAALGLLGGPWWQVYVGERPFGDPMVARAYRTQVRVEEPPSVPGDPPEVRFEPAALPPYALAAAALVVAFFFASYDLVADDDLQLPILLATLAAAAVGAFVVYDVLLQESALREPIELVEAARVQAAVAQVGSGDPAAATSPPALSIGLRPGWGLSLFLASTLALLIDSVYLTFLAPRETS